MKLFNRCFSLRDCVSALGIIIALAGLILAVANRCGQSAQVSSSAVSEPAAGTTEQTAKSEADETKSSAEPEVSSDDKADHAMISLPGGASLLQPVNYNSSYSWPIIIAVGKCVLPDCPAAFLLRIPSSDVLMPVWKYVDDMTYSVDDSRIVMVVDSDNLVALTRAASRLSAGLVICSSRGNATTVPPCHAVVTIGDVSRYAADWRNFRGNLAHLPIFVLAGCDSDGIAVPPVAARQIVRMLKGGAAGMNVEYMESPVALTPELVSWPLVWCTSKVKTHGPAEFEWKMGQDSVRNAWWITAGQPLTPQNPSELKATAADHRHITVTTDNVASLAIVRDPLFFDAHAPLIVTIDGTKVILPMVPKEENAMNKKYWLRRSATRAWDVEEHNKPPRLQKQIGARGGLAPVLYGKVLIVYGASSEQQTMNDCWKQTADALQEHLKNYVGILSVRVLSDTNVTMDDLDEETVILLGGTEDNHISEVVRSEIPLVKLFNSLNEKVNFDSTLFAFALAYPIADSQNGTHLALMIGARSPEAVNRLLDKIEKNPDSRNAADCLILDDASEVWGAFDGEWN